MPVNQDHMAEWTAQSDGLPEPPGEKLPQTYLPEQLPEDMPEEPRRVIEEGYLAGDATEVDPPGAVALNREIDSPHLSGYAGMEAPAPDAANAEAGDGTPDDSWTKAELQEYADANGIEVNSSMTKAEMLEAIG